MVFKFATTKKVSTGLNIISHIVSVATFFNLPVWLATYLPKNISQSTPFPANVVP